MIAELIAMMLAVFGAPAASLGGCEVNLPEFSDVSYVWTIGTSVHPVPADQRGLEGDHGLTPEAWVALDCWSPTRSRFGAREGVSVARATMPTELESMTEVFGRLAELEPADISAALVSVRDEIDPALDVSAREFDDGWLVRVAGQTRICEATEDELGTIDVKSLDVCMVRDDRLNLEMRRWYRARSTGRD